MNHTENKVHALYWNQNLNCARTMLLCLGDRFHVAIAPQTLQAAVGMHGAGRFRAQCGLVEGALMFAGIIGSCDGHSDKDIESLCFRFAEAFTNRFGSLLCRDIRPDGARPSGPIPYRTDRMFCGKFSSCLRHPSLKTMLNTFTSKE